MIDVGAIGQEHIGKGALILVEAVRLDGDFFFEGEVRGGLYSSATVEPQGFYAQDGGNWFI